jgi:hypothetical protein
VSAELVKSILKKGDEIVAYSDPLWRTAQLSGTVKSVGRVNVKIRTQVRCRPEGPWYDQEHSVPLGAISIIARGKDVLLDLQKKASW